MSHRRSCPRAATPPRASKYSVTASNAVFVSPCASSRCLIQDRSLIRDRIASHFQIAERPHRLDIVE